jgi:hypothetical protein
MKKIIQYLLFLFSGILIAQQTATSAVLIEKALKEKEILEKTSLVKNVNFTNIGPTIMSGRVADIDVNPNNTMEFYVGYASGGLWYTKNNGTTFTPVLDSSE